MAIVTKKDGRIYVRFRDKETKKQKDVYCGKGDIGLKKAQFEEAKLNLRSYNKKDFVNPFLVPIFNKYLKDYKRRDNSGRNRNIDILNSLINGILLKHLDGGNQLKVYDINHDLLDNYVDKRLDNKIKKTSISRELSVLRAALNFAVKKEDIPFSPMQGYKLPSGKPIDLEPPTHDEIMAIIAHAKPHVVRAICLQYNTGMRPGMEMLNTTWRKFDPHNKILTIVSAQKGGSPFRIIPLKDTFINMLIKWHEEDIEKGLTDDISIVNWQGVGIKNYRESLYTAMKKANINRRFRPYDIRHAFATTVLEQGADLKTTAAILGHDPKTTIKHYQHINSAMKFRTVNMIPDIDPTFVNKNTSADPTIFNGEKKESKKAQQNTENIINFKVRK